MDPFIILDRAREHNLGETAVRVLIYVSAGITSQTRIASKVGKTRSAVGQIVKTLITRELLSKSRSGINETKVILALTLSGREMIDQITPPSPAPLHSPDSRCPNSTSSPSTINPQPSTFLK